MNALNLLVIFGISWSPFDACSYLLDCTPHAIFDQTTSCTKYETKPAIDPAMAIAPLAATEPV
jgi:hypothetical protein